MSENDLFGVTGPDVRMVIDEIRRELAMRQQLYPKWVANHKLEPGIAEHRIACLVNAIEMLEPLLEHETHYPKRYDDDAGRAGEP